MYLERCAVFEAVKVDAIAKALLHRDWQLTAAANLYEYAKYASHAVCEVRSHTAHPLLWPPLAAPAAPAARAWRPRHRHRPARNRTHAEPEA